MAGQGKSRSNIPGLVAMLGMIALIAGVLWIYYTAGVSALTLSPLGLLLVIGAVLAISGTTRRAAREQDAARKLPRSYYARRRDDINNAAAQNQDLRPYDGSYCPHCGLEARGGDHICRRCGGAL